MRIHDIIIDNVRGLEHLELGPLPDDGVIIVYGDNEAGKSTIFDALDALLTTGHGSKSKDIKALKPIGRDASPRVSVRMTLGETSLTATKQWLKGKMSELEIHAPQHAHYTAREADDKLAELLREHVDDSLMKTLFVRQDSLDANVAAAGIPSLQRALSGTDGDGDVDVAEDDALIAVVTDEYLRYFTKTGKHNAQFTGLEEQARQAEEELHHARHVHRHLQYHVDRVGQAFTGGRRDHLLADQAHIVVGATGVFRRQRMGAKQGGGHPHRAQLAEAAGHAQHLQLVGQGQAVTGLDLDRGHAIGQQRVETRQAGGDQLVLAGGAGGAHAAEDAAAGAGDFLVADAFQALLELTGAVAGVHQMGMAVDQARRHHPAAPDLVGTDGQGWVELALGPQAGDLIPLDQHGHGLGQHLQAIEDSQIAPEQALAGRLGHCGAILGVNVYTFKP